jgi:hypothetical protein
MNERRILDEFQEAAREDTIIPIISGESEGSGWKVTGGIVGWLQRIWRGKDNGRRK